MELDKKKCVMYRLQEEKKAVKTRYFGQGKIEFDQEKSGNFVAN